MITNCVDFIRLQEFIEQMLEETALVYICHVIIVEDGQSHVHPSRIAQILTTFSQPVILPEAY